LPWHLFNITTLSGFVKGFGKVFFEFFCYYLYALPRKGFGVYEL
jgi:hypothetical protein